MMRKLLIIGALGLLLGGCAKPYPPSMADPNDPTKPAFTPQLRNMVLNTILAGNPNVIFSEAAISNPVYAGSAVFAKYESYRVCARWKGFDLSNGQEISRYTVVLFTNGRAVKSRNPAFDACSFLGSPEYQPFPELVASRSEIRKRIMPAMGK